MPWHVWFHLTPPQKNLSQATTQENLDCSSLAAPPLTQPSLLHGSLLLGENLQCLLPGNRTAKCDPSLTLPPLLGSWAKIVSDVLILPQEKPNKGIPPPALKENGELRFPWAAKMNPQSPPCHFPDVPRGVWYTND